MSEAPADGVADRHCFAWNERSLPRRRLAQDPIIVAPTHGSNIASDLYLFGLIINIDIRPKRESDWQGGRFRGKEEQNGHLVISMVVLWEPF